MLTKSLGRVVIHTLLSCSLVSPGSSHNLTPGQLRNLDHPLSVNHNLDSPGNVTHSGYRNVAYYVNWAIYARDHQPQDVPVENLTHLLYAFANVIPETGEVYLTDSWSDTEKRYNSDSWNDTGTNLYGCLKQIYLHKKRNRNLKVLLSIGGWNYSPNFALPASTPEGRQNFSRSAIDLLRNLPFDGFDVDWEYPASPEEGANLVSLLASVRKELDIYTASIPSRPHFLLTAASPTGPQHFPNFPICDIDQYLDFWNLMAYDYAGSWDRMAGHQANVFFSNSTPTSTPFSTDAAVSYYVGEGVATGKIVMGMPLYGRAFQKTAGPGAPFEGVGDGSWENGTGTWDYKVLPKPGAQVLSDPAAIASWSYDDASLTMISYDTPQVVCQKINYIKNSRLGGAMFWETSGDRPCLSGDSLIDIAAKHLGGQDRSQMEQSENSLEYPLSKYDNLRLGMPNE